MGHPAACESVGVRRTEVSWRAGHRPVSFHSTLSHGCGETRPRSCAAEETLVTVVTVLRRPHLGRASRSSRAAPRRAPWPYSKLRARLLRLSGPVAGNTAV